MPDKSSPATRNGKVLTGAYIDEAEYLELCNIARELKINRSGLIRLAIRNLIESHRDGGAINPYEPTRLVAYIGPDWPRGERA